MHCAADRKLEECAKERQKPQVPGRPLQLEKTKQQSTCVSKLMLTGAEWKREELSLVTTEDIRHEFRCQWDMQNGFFVSLLFRKFFHPYEFSQEK